MLAPERDQSATRDAIKEIEIFLQRYPNSQLMPEARQASARPRIGSSEANYRVGYFYYRHGGTRAPSIVSRTCSRATRSSRGVTRVYFHLAESLYRTDKEARSAPLLRTAPPRIREERVSRCRPETDGGAEGRDAQESRIQNAERMLVGRRLWMLHLPRCAGAPGARHHGAADCRCSAPTCRVTRRRGAPLRVAASRARRRWPHWRLRRVRWS